MYAILIKQTLLFQTVDFLKKLITEAEEVEYTAWYFRTNERISSLNVFVSILKLSL